MSRWTQTLEERLWAKVAKGESNDCWMWTARLSAAGYARFFVNGKDKQASRVVYELIVGPIAQGLELDHLCRNPRCVRPDHLEPVTHLENMQRSTRSSATHCINGHEFTPENTALRPRNQSVQRRCRACERRWAAEHGQRVRTYITEMSS